MVDTEISRAPSYFSRFFEEQLRQSEDPNGGVKTLYIDRDPTTFQDICRHLQGLPALPVMLWPQWLTKSSRLRNTTN